jgi:hypothetical protein
MSKCQERHSHAGQILFIDPQRNRDVMLKGGVSARRPDAPNPTSGHLIVTTCPRFEPAPLDFNGQVTQHNS